MGFFMQKKVHVCKLLRNWCLVQIVTLPLPYWSCDGLQLTSATLSARGVESWKEINGWKFMCKYLKISRQKIIRGCAGHECRRVVCCRLPVPTADALEPTSSSAGRSLANTAVDLLKHGSPSCRACASCSWRLKMKQIVDAAEQVSLHLTGRNTRLREQTARVA